MKVAEVSLQLLATGTAYLEAVDASVYFHSVKNFHYSIFGVMKKGTAQTTEEQSALLNRWLNTIVVHDAF